jgi:hypothetical protein
MSDLISQFERDCADARVLPPDALQAGNVHRTLWRKWSLGKVSPTLKSFEAALAGLAQLRMRNEQGDAAVSDQ